jgi:hypothetical protein
MHQFETEFEKQLEALDSESRTAAVFAYTELAMMYCAGSDPDLLERLQPHAGFWNAVGGALQTAAFVALGRVYDNDRQTHNAGQLLTYADDHPGIFARAVLEARKVRTGLAPELARDYVVDAYEPVRGFLAPLRVEFEKRQSFYLAKVAPIRHKVFAHRAKIDRGERDRLFSELMVRGLEDVVAFPCRLHRALFNLYWNGREPILSDAATTIGDALKATDSWDHIEAGRNAERFFAWLGSAAIDQSGMQP